MSTWHKTLNTQHFCQWTFPSCQIEEKLDWNLLYAECFLNHTIAEWFSTGISAQWYNRFSCYFIQKWFRLLKISLETFHSTIRSQNLLLIAEIIGWSWSSPMSTVRSNWNPSNRISTSVLISLARPSNTRERDPDPPRVLVRRRTPQWHSQEDGSYQI